MYRKINDLGRAELAHAVRRVTHARLLDDDCEAWECDAERKANEARDVDRANVEVESYYTASGRPELVPLDSNWFDELHDDE